MNNRHPFRRHAHGRMIDIEQKIDVATLAENDIGVYTQVCGVLGARSRGGKTCQCRNCRKRARRFHKITSADLLHLPPLQLYSVDDHTPSRKSKLRNSARRLCVGGLLPLLPKWYQKNPLDCEAIAVAIF